MGRYRVLCMIIALLFLGAVIVVNISLQAEKEQLDRPYMVEIAGLAERMNAEGSVSFDETGEGNLPERNGCRYVTAVIPCEKESDLVAAGTEDYCIREVNGQLYRFEYRTGSNRTRMTVIVNAVLTDDNQPCPRPDYTSRSRKPLCGRKDHRTISPTGAGSR